MNKTWYIFSGNTIEVENKLNEFEKICQFIVVSMNNFNEKFIVLIKITGKKK